MEIWSHRGKQTSSNIYQIILGDFEVPSSSSTNFVGIIVNLRLNFHDHILKSLINSFSFWKVWLIVFSNKNSFLWPIMDYPILLSFNMGECKINYKYKMLWKRNISRLTWVAEISDNIFKGIFNCCWGKSKWLRKFYLNVCFVYMYRTIQQRF